MKIFFAIMVFIGAIIFTGYVNYDKFIENKKIANNYVAYTDGVILSCGDKRFSNTDYMQERKFSGEELYYSQLGIFFKNKPLDFNNKQSVLVYSHYTAEANAKTNYDNIIAYLTSWQDDNFSIYIDEYRQVGDLNNSTLQFLSSRNIRDCEPTYK